MAHFTFINQDLQQTLEALAKQRQSQLEPQASIALLVVENRSRRVRAYVGASDFFDTRRAGQVDMVRAIRSPGSTLKPLVYGLAFDELLIHPETLLEDVPTRFGGYAPANFHNTYAGQLTVREALQPVSYTHLDVYKRQSVEQAGDEAFIIIANRGTRKWQSRAVQILRNSHGEQQIVQVGLFDAQHALSLIHI